MGGIRLTSGQYKLFFQNCKKNKTKYPSNPLISITKQLFYLWVPYRKRLVK